jgi:hypothetical protein
MPRFSALCESITPAFCSNYLIVCLHFEPLHLMRSVHTLRISPRRRSAGAKRLMRWNSTEQKPVVANRVRPKIMVRCRAQECQHERRVLGVIVRPPSRVVPAATNAASGPGSCFGTCTRGKRAKTYSRSSRTLCLNVRSTMLVAIKDAPWQV